MRFELVDAAKKEFPVQRLCKVLDVSPSGYFAWKGALLAVASARTWCCSLMSARPLPYRTRPTGARAWYTSCAATAWSSDAGALPG